MCAAINTQGSTDHHRVVIVGGGAAGITVAAILRRHRHDLDIALLEPSDSHYYQPASRSWAAAFTTWRRPAAPRPG